MAEIADAVASSSLSDAVAVPRHEGASPFALSPGGELAPVGDAPRIDPALWRALGRASRRVTELALSGVPADAPVPDFHLIVDRLCMDVRRAVRDDHAPIADYPPGVRVRPLVDALRRALLDDLQKRSVAVPGRDIVEVLRGLERVHCALDGDVSQRFTGRLAERDGPALVVEVAHDMRSPLTSILFLVETLRMGQSGPLTPVQDRQLGLVYSAALGLSSLTNDVIDLARGGERLVDAQPIAFSVRETFNAVRDIVQPIAAEKQLSVRLAPPDADFRVGFPSALNRVLLNLTTNALKFTRSGYVEVTGRQLSRTLVEFSVADTGRGIPPHVMNSLCDAFRPTPKPGTEVFSSAGLGLAICQKLVRAMGGELKAESTPDVGSRLFFTIDMPPAPRL